MGSIRDNKPGVYQRATLSGSLRTQDLIQKDTASVLLCGNGTNLELGVFVTLFSLVCILIAIFMLNAAFGLPYIVAFSLGLIWSVFQLYFLSGLEWWSARKVSMAGYDPIAISFWKAVNTFVSSLYLVPQGTILAGAIWILYSYFSIEN